MELLLHYVWHNGLFDTDALITTDGRPIEVVRRGIYNRNAGADFSGAHLRIGNQLWVGDVEMHQNASEWFTHGHHTDKAYNNVILHIVENSDAIARTEAGAALPQMTIRIPEQVRHSYEQLLQADSYPPCHKALSHLEPLMLRQILTTLTIERLEDRTARINRYRTLVKDDWERVLFVALARGFGFGLNGETFERWALNIEPSNVGKHRDDPSLVEAYFLGTAGLLEEEVVPTDARDEAYQVLCRDFLFLRSKFGLTSLAPSLWKFLRLRPQNFPHVRISQLVQLYCQGKLTVANLLATTNVEEVQTLLSTTATPYWQTHYRFGHCTTKQSKALQRASLNRLVINTIVPFLFTYGRAHDQEDICERAFAFLETLPAENDHIIRKWQAAGFTPQNAADSQALNHLYTSYCTSHRCLACQIGRKFIQIIH